MTTRRAQRTVSCPQCARPALYAPENRWRPFCSERCRLIDLGHWANESYRVAAADTGFDPASLAASETDMLSSEG